MSITGDIQKCDKLKFLFMNIDQHMFFPIQSFVWQNEIFAQVLYD